MRRLHALLIAGLLTAPASALASPDAPAPKSDDPTTQTFEWSMSTSRARLGVMVIGLTPELRTHLGAPSDRGVIVGRVEPHSAAAAAGLAVGDVITTVKGEAVDDGGDVLAALASSKKGDTVSIAVIRDRKPLTLSAKLVNDAGPTSMSNAPWPAWIREWFQRGPAEMFGPPAPDPMGRKRT